MNSELRPERSRLLQGLGEAQTQLSFERDKGKHEYGEAGMCSGAQSLELELIVNRGNVILTCVVIRDVIEISKAREHLPWVNSLSHGYESVRSFSLKLPRCGDENAWTPIPRKSLRIAWVHVMAERSLCQ
jgi:hypothetical protein